MSNDDLMNVPDVTTLVDSRFVEIPRVGKWMTLADERVWDDYDAMMEHLNSREVEAELRAYVAHLEATAKKRLSRPAVKPVMITRGKYQGQMRKARPAYTPTERAIETFIGAQSRAVRDYLVWTMQCN